MKIIATYCLTISLLLHGGLSVTAQNVGVNNPSPNPKALLDLTDTTRGLLIPRMTQVQRLAMFPLADATANGMMVYQTDNTAGFYFYDGSNWSPVNNISNQWSLSGNTGTTLSNYIGTADSTPLTLKTNGQERMRISANGKVALGGALNTSWLTLPDSLGEKLTLYTGGTGFNYGFGIQSSLLQIHSSNSGSSIAMGWGTSADFHENMRLTGSGKMILGNPAVPYSAYSAGLVILDTIGSNNGLYIQSNVAESDIFLAKSHGTAISPTAVVSGDQLGGVWGLGYEGSYQSVSSAITFLVDSTPGANYIPGMICFGTSSAPGNFVSGKDYINRYGYLGILKYPTYALDVNGDINMPLTGAFRVNGVTLFSSAVNSNISAGISSGSSSMGTMNSYLGFEAGLSAAGGTNNTFSGASAGYTNLTGSNNTFMGYHAGYLNTAGQNTFLGANAGAANTSGSQNVLVGYNAGTANTASGGTFIGHGAGSLNTNGADNTAIGQDAGNTNTTGDNNVFIGNNSDAASGNLGFAVAIGADAVVGASNSMVLGGTGSAAVKVGIGMTTPNTTLDVLGALSIRDDGTTTDVTGDDFTITVSNRSYIRLTSNNATAANRTISLSNGLQRGQILYIENVDGAADQIQVADNAAVNNTNTPANRTLDPGDIIILLWNGTDWMETGFNNNN